MLDLILACYGLDFFLNLVLFYCYFLFLFIYSFFFFSFYELKQNCH